MAVPSDPARLAFADSKILRFEQSRKAPSVERESEAVFEQDTMSTDLDRAEHQALPRGAIAALIMIVLIWIAVLGWLLTWLFKL